MIDNSNTFRNFKESVPKSPGSLPKMPFTNSKDVIIRWLEHRFTRMNLTHPVILLGEYPSQTTLSSLPVGEDGVMITNNLRGVSVVLLDGSVKRQGVGQVINGAEVPNDADENSVIEYGWHEKMQMEISYWSVSSRDRDYGGDLIRAFMFEAFRVGWFLQNGLIEMHMHNYYDTADARLSTLNRMLSYNVSVFEFTRTFFGTIDYSQFREMSRVGEITMGMEVDLTQSDETESYSPSSGNVFMPASGNGMMASFDRLNDGIIVLPGGTSSSLTDYRSENTSSSHLTICTGSII